MSCGQFKRVNKDGRMLRISHSRDPSKVWRNIGASQTRTRNDGTVGGGTNQLQTISDDLRMIEWSRTLAKRLMLEKDAPRIRGLCLVICVSSKSEGYRRARIKMDPTVYSGRGKSSNILAK